MQGEGLDGLLVTHLPNIRYLTGFTGSAALLLIRADASVLISDFRYSEQALVEVGAAATVEIDQRSVWERLGRMLAGRPVGQLGVEAQSLTVRDAERVSGLTRGRVLPTSDLVENLRVVKSPEEVAAIRDAAALAQEALAEVLPTVRPEQTELEIGSALEAAITPAVEVSGTPFLPSLPRVRDPLCPTRGPADRAIRAGELLLLDFGAQVNGYCADLTRTVIVGARADDRQRTVYELVQAAQRRAIEHLRPGMPAREGDALARDVIATRGFGEAFGHSLGHGLGLEVHEAPRLALRHRIHRCRNMPW